MTTVFGLTHPEVEGVVLVADRQTTYIDNQGMPVKKTLKRKLRVSEDGNFGFGHAGNRDERAEEFLEKLASGEFDIEKIISKRYFPQLRQLNMKRMGRKLPDLQRLSGLVLATKFEGNPRLHTCFPYGHVGERNWVPIGSGSSKIEEYMNALLILSEAKNYLGTNSKAEMGDLIRVGLEAVRRSQSQDIYSHGLDMVVCTGEEINDHYEDLGDDFGKKLKSLQRKYKLKK